MNKILCIGCTKDEIQSTIMEDSDKIVTIIHYQKKFKNATV